ncbi:MAG: S41 family peptidase [Candidatus Omnitrophica bacterium]|jgi:carboxyl-terminal processing protease|nr:S41 family peptidase [Candidatus Omnitrophota bacterium]
MRKRFLLGVIITALICVGIFSYYNKVSIAKEREDNFYKELDVFAEALAVIEKKYVEEKPPHDLIYGALDGLLASLDSYSEFLSPDEYRELLVDTEGKFGGLGVEITIRDTLLTVVSPMEDTPAWTAGLKPGDIIVKIDGKVTKGITITEAVKKLRGDPGTKVTLTVLKEKDKKLEDVTLVRAIIKIKDIKHAEILEDGIGYVRIAEFRENTARDLDRALQELNKKGLKAIVIDVRNNPGGLLESAIDVTSRFLETDKVVVSTKSRTEKENVYKSVALREKYSALPIVVLVNKGSASASEILASALRDNKKAVVMGETSFGKGSVQTIIPLSDGSALRLTTSRYYTPLGTSIHEKGVTPDIVVVNDVGTDRKEDVFEKLETKTEFDYKKDYLIVRAADFLKGMLVLEK